MEGLKETKSSCGELRWCRTNPPKHVDRTKLPTSWDGWSTVIHGHQCDGYTEYIYIYFFFICMCVYTCVYIYIYICIYVYTYTYWNIFYCVKDFQGFCSSTLQLEPGFCPSIACCGTNDFEDDVGHPTSPFSPKTPNLAGHRGFFRERGEHPFLLLGGMCLKGASVRRLRNCQER